MLNALREWLTTVVSVTLLLSLLHALTPEGAVRRAASFTGGLVLAAALLRPLAGKRPDFPSWDGAAYRAEVAERRAALERESAELLEAEVSRRTAEAASRQAARLGTVRRVTVQVRTENGVPLPWTVDLSGERNAALEAWISSELGIPPSRQTWTGEAQMVTGTETSVEAEERQEAEDLQETGDLQEAVGPTGSGDLQETEGESPYSVASG